MFIDPSVTDMDTSKQLLIMVTNSHCQNSFFFVYDSKRALRLSENDYSFTLKQ